MDPILEEMTRAKSPKDVRESRFRDWVDYLCALVAAKDDEIATLQARLDELGGMPEQQSAVKRGPGRPRTCAVCGQPETRHADTCAAGAAHV